MLKSKGINKKLYFTALAKTITTRSIRNNRILNFYFFYWNSVLLDFYNCFRFRTIIGLLGNATGCLKVKIHALSANHIRITSRTGQNASLAIMNR